MPKATRSYANRRRPPLIDAIQAEGKETTKEALISLERKGYFTARPRPWQLGFRDRGHGHGDFAVLDRFGDLVAETCEKSDAELIIVAVNAHKT